MASFSRKTRIVGALVIAGVLVVGSVVISGSGLSFLNPATVNAASTQELLQSFATRDSDNDGLPDWEEQLYGLDPNNAHSFSPTMTDGEAVSQGLVKPKFMTQELASSSDATSTDPYPDAPTAAAGSLTEQFSQALLTQYFSQNTSGSEPTEADIQNLAQGTMQSFALQHQHQNAYTISQVIHGGTGQSALITYLSDAAPAFNASLTNDPNTELDYFTDALEKNDTTALPKVAALGKVYSTMASGLMQVSVPIEMQNAHLDLVNALTKVGADCADLSTLNTDPLRAYFGLAQYEIDAPKAASAFAEVGAVLSAEQVTLKKGDPGFDYYGTALYAQNVLPSTAQQGVVSGK